VQYLAIVLACHRTSSICGGQNQGLGVRSVGCQIFSFEADNLAGAKTQTLGSKSWGVAASPRRAEPGSCHCLLSRKGCPKPLRGPCLPREPCDGIGFPHRMGHGLTASTSCESARHVHLSEGFKGGATALSSNSSEARKPVKRCASCCREGLRIARSCRHQGCTSRDPEPSGRCGGLFSALLATKRLKQPTV